MLLLRTIFSDGVAALFSGFDIMRFIVTRPESEAQAMRKRLEERGHETVLAPLLRIEPVAGAFDGLDGLDDVQALVVTSGNALAALESLALPAHLKELPLIAVGTATASRARSAGWSPVIEGKGAAGDLPKLIRRHLDPQKGAVLHLAGDVLAIDLGPALAQMGFGYRKIEVYRARPVDVLPRDAEGSLRNASADAVILMSARTAGVYQDLVRKAGLEAEARRLAHLCLSEAVARPIRETGAQDIRVAIRPNSEEMLALVDQLSSSSSR